LDYDFDWFVFDFEYKLENGQKINENDIKYLEYSELLLQAKEYGLGYRVEWENTLYLVPTPLVILEDQRMHSLVEPALRWKEGAEFFYIFGVNFEKELWEKVVTKTLEPKEILSLGNTEQRMVAMKVYGMESFLDALKAKLLDKSARGNELYLLSNVFESFPKAYYTKVVCPSTGRIYVEGVDPEFAKDNVNADACVANQLGISIEDYTRMEVEA